MRVTNFATLALVLGLVSSATATAKVKVVTTLSDYAWAVRAVGGELVEVEAICPPEQDPLLVNRSQDHRRLPLAGAAFHRARVGEVIGDEDMCRTEWEEFLAAWQ